MGAASQGSDQADFSSASTLDKETTTFASAAHIGSRPSSWKRLPAPVPVIDASGAEWVITCKAAGWKRFVDQLHHSYIVNHSTCIKMLRNSRHLLSDRSKTACYMVQPENPFARWALDWCEQGQPPQTRTQSSRTLRLELQTLTLHAEDQWFWYTREVHKTARVPQWTSMSRKFVSELAAAMSGVWRQGGTDDSLSEEHRDFRRNVPPPSAEAVEAFYRAWAKSTDIAPEETRARSPIEAEASSQSQSDPLESRGSPPSPRPRVTADPRSFRVHMPSLGYKDSVNIGGREVRGGDLTSERAQEIAAAPASAMPGAQFIREIPQDVPMTGTYVGVPYSSPQPPATVVAPPFRVQENWDTAVCGLTGWQSRRETEAPSPALTHATPLRDAETDGVDSRGVDRNSTWVKGTMDRRNGIVTFIWDKDCTSVRWAISRKASTTYYLAKPDPKDQTGTTGRYPPNVLVVPYGQLLPNVPLQVELQFERHIDDTVMWDSVGTLHQTIDPALPEERESIGLLQMRMRAMLTGTWFHPTMREDQKAFCRGEKGWLDRGLPPESVLRDCLRAYTREETVYNAELQARLEAMPAGDGCLGAASDSHGSTHGSHTTHRSQPSDSVMCGNGLQIEGQSQANPVDLTNSPSPPAPATLQPAPASATSAMAPPPRPLLPGRRYVAIQPASAVPPNHPRTADSSATAGRSATAGSDTGSLLWTTALTPGSFTSDNVYAPVPQPRLESHEQAIAPTADRPGQQGDHARSGHSQPNWRDYVADRQSRRAGLAPRAPWRG